MDDNNLNDGRQENPYGRAHENAYENRQDNSYGSRQEGPHENAYENRQEDPYGSGQEDPYGSRQENPYGRAHENAYENHQEGAYGSRQAYYGQEQMNGARQEGQHPYGPYQRYNQYQKADSGRYGNMFGIISMVLGMISLVLFCTCINIPIAIAAVIFAIIQLTRSSEGRVPAIAGIITAAISIVLCIIMLILAAPYLERLRHELIESPHSGYDYDWDEYDEFPDDFGDYFDFFDGGGF